MLDHGMIDNATWRMGRDSLIPYYGQDFGGQYGDDKDEEDQEEQSGEQAGGEDQRILSEEYVYDSDE
ncbi:hypothetical protein HRG_012519 [Hirsutella rhossiliensis]